jgi:rod shape-determining protein MreB
MRGGVVTDVRCAAKILGKLFTRTRTFGLAKPRVVASLPSDASSDERDGLLQAVRQAGASAIVTFPEPLAAAVGSGIDVGSPYAQMILDIGHGVTDCVVIRGGEVVGSAALRVGCADLERLVMDHLASLGAPIDRRVALELVDELRFDERPHGTGSTRVESRRAGVVEVDLGQLGASVAGWQESVVGVAKQLSRDVPAEVGAELVESGVFVTGGGSMVPGLVAAVAAATGLDAVRVPDPLGAVLEGNRSLLGTVARLGAWG